MFNRSNLAWAKQTPPAPAVAVVSDNNNNSNNKPEKSEPFYYHYHLTTLILVLLLVNTTLVTSTLGAATSSSGGSPLNSSSSFNPKPSIFGRAEDNSIFDRILGPAIFAFGSSGGRRLLAADDDGGGGGGGGGGAYTLQESQDDHLGINRLAESRGFSIESHQVTTHDGYILTIHRLVNPLLSGGGGGTPVILQHGILCASPLFLLASSPELDRARRRQGQPNGTATSIPSKNGTTTTTTSISNSLAIELAQSGYDVWLPNFRGTQYSRKHLNPKWNGRRAQSRGDGRAYWNFNVDSLVEHDLAAYVRYILKLTGRPRYMFIGHSLGATVGLGSLLVHRDTEITRQLSCMILMAPVASTQFMRGHLMSLFRAASLLYQEPGPFPGATRTFSSFVGHICPRLRKLCVWLASMFIGAKRQSPPDAIAANSSSHHARTAKLEFQNQIRTFLMMMRQSVSVQMLQHIVQVHSSGRLSRFNYGPSANVGRYGKRLAPIYDLDKISQPKLRLAIVSGQSDAISTRDEIGWISEQVRDKVGHFEQITVPVSPFNHMDLIMSSEAGNLVNKRMLEFIHRNECA